MKTASTIGDYFRQPNGDNFVFMRVLAATAVIYGHSFALSAIKEYKDIVLNYIKHTHTAHEAVSIFFVISGFLVTASYLNRGSIWFYIKSRFLRIFPALITCTLVTALLLGPIVTNLKVANYYQNIQTYLYILKNISLIKLTFTLPGVFDHNPFGPGVNGSMWTLPAELRLYLILGFIGVLGILQKKCIFNFFSGVALFIGIFWPEFFPLLRSNPKYFRLGAMFLFGSLMYINRWRIPLNLKFLLLLFLPVPITFKTNHFMVFFSIFLAYGTIWFAYVPRIKIGRYLPDNSYGLYIYAFPVQQTIVNYYPKISPYPLFICAFILTYLIALLSWYYIERPALKLKGSAAKRKKRNNEDAPDER